MQIRTKTAKRHNRTAVIFIAVLLLSSCAEAPQRDAQDSAVKVPNHWTATDTQGNPVATSWLASFSDAALTALVHEALDNNFDLKALAARVAAARQQAQIDGAGRLPQLAFTPDYQRAQRDSNTSSAFDALFSLSWEIDLWGRILAAQQASQQAAKAVLADYQAAKLSLAARTAQTYFELLEAQLQVQVAEQSIKDRHTIVELVQGRFQRGLSRGLDLRLVLTDYENAKAQLAAAHNQTQILARRLEVLLGHYPKGDSDALKLKQVLPSPPTELRAGVPSGLLSRRPDLVAAFSRLKAADKRLESAKKALLPRLTLNAAGGSSTSVLAQFADPKGLAWNVALGLAQPVFTGGRLTGEIHLNEARVEEAHNQYKSTALTAFREVEQTLAAEQWLRQQERAVQAAVEQTQASRKLAVTSYRQGLIEILTLLDSYRSTLNAQSEHLQIQRQLLNNRIELYLALGGGV